MAFGGDPFGYGPFGEIVETPSVRYEPVPPPAAILIDLEARDAVLDADGRYEGTDPIDQQVALSFGVPRGSIKHAPDLGHDFLTLPGVTGDRLRVECERRAAAATPFADLLTSGAVELVSVTHQEPKRGEVRIAIAYKKRGETRVRTAVVGST